MRELNLAQRIVGVVTLAAILWLVGAYVTSPSPFSGWTGYAPLQSAYVGRDRLSSLGSLFVWLGVVLVWCAVSLLIMRGSLRRGRTATPGHGAVRPVDVAEE